MSSRFLVVALLGACTLGTSAPSPQLVAAVPEPAGSNCATGGVAIETGTDDNDNGTLDASEVTSTTYVCAGANGAGGSNGSDGSNGSNGSNGTNGTDGSNGSNGTDGSNGSNGSNGVDELVAVVAEPPGANCTTGGQAIEIGYDTNANGALDPSEVSSTQYVCNPANPIVHDGGLTISNASETYRLIGVQRIGGKLYIDAASATSVDVSSLVQVDSGIEIDHFGGTSMAFTSLQTTPSFVSGFSYFTVSMPALSQIDTLFAYSPAFSADSLTAVTTSMVVVGLTSDMTMPALQHAAYIDVEAAGQPYLFSAPAATELDLISLFAMNADFPALTQTNGVWLQKDISFSAPAITSTYWLEMDNTLFSTLPVDPSHVYQYYLGDNANLTVSSPQTSIDTIDVYGVVGLDFPNLASASYFTVESTQLTQVSMPALASVLTLQIDNNAQLTDISFPAFASASDVFITNNPNLPTCQATALTQYATNSESHNGNNDAGTCN